jgi:plastocyanin
MRRALLVVGLLAGAAVLWAGDLGAASGTPAKHTVTMDITGYSPATLTVKKGDTVTWVNKDVMPHTATAARGFDSRSVAPNAKWTYRATQAGEFPYICTLHPNMKGTLKVE